MCKERRDFEPMRDVHGRITKVGKEYVPVKKQKAREYPVPPQGYVFHVKPWLTRKEMSWEYPCCSARTIRELEKRNHLVPRVLLGTYIYKRSEIEAALEESKVREPSPLIAKGGI